MMPTEDLSIALVPPEQAKYRPSEGAGACGDCAFFSPGLEGEPGSCSRVAGPIDPSMVCDLYSPASGEDELRSTAVLGEY